MYEDELLRSVSTLCTSFIKVRQCQLLFGNQMELKPRKIYLNSPSFPSKTSFKLVMVKFECRSAVKNAKRLKLDHPDSKSTKNVETQLYYITNKLSAAIFNNQ